MPRTSKIRVFKNKDKEGWYESWAPNRDLMNFPHPTRILMSARPGSGKTNIIKNIIVKAKPHYQRIFLCHYDPDTKEYNDLKVIPLKKLPKPTAKYFNTKYKNLLIIDDYEYRRLTADQLNSLNRLWGYASTHRGLTIIAATQNWFSLPIDIRQMSDVFFIWKGTTDLPNLHMIGRKFGLNKDETVELFKHCKKKYDFICFDYTIDSPMPIRFNGYIDIAPKNSEIYNAIGPGNNNNPTTFTNQEKEDTEEDNDNK